MPETAFAEKFLATLRAARLISDLDTIIALFDADATFAIVGFGAPAHGRTAIRAVLATLIEQFEFLDWQPIETLANGQHIAVRHTLRVRHRPNGKTTETQTAEFLTLKDGLCASFTQFADTVLIAELMKD